MTETPKFDCKFDGYVVEGDKIVTEIDGFTCIATIYTDDDSTPPWDRSDGHGPVSEWTARKKEPGERVLCYDRNSYRYYDFQEAVKIARRDGWRVHPEHSTDQPGKVAAEAAEADFKFLKSWCDDRWHYVGVAVTVEKNDIRLTGEYEHALWGIECNLSSDGNDYLTEVANELLPEAIESARKAIASLTEA